MGCLWSRLFSSNHASVVAEEAFTGCLPLLVPLIHKPIVLIGLTGKAGAGKDTLADYMVEAYGFEKKSFAGPLKRGISELFSIPMTVLNDPILKERQNSEWNKSPRELMQWLGTDVLRKHIRDDFFITSLATELNNSDSQRVVITDVRFDQEAEYLNYIDAPIIRIDAGERGSAIGINESKHVSESGIDDRYVNFTIQNDRSIQDLKDTFDSFVSEELELF